MKEAQPPIFSETAQTPQIKHPPESPAKAGYCDIGNLIYRKHI